MLDRRFIFGYNMPMKDLRYLQLWDVYAPVLTDNQREICELYYLCDLSLTEIAEQKGVSKQSVSDALAKSRALLDDFENKLHINENNIKYSLEISAKFTKITKLLENFKVKHTEFSAEMDEIIAVLEEDGEKIAEVLD